MVKNQEHRSLVQSDFTAKFLFLQMFFAICLLEVQNCSNTLTVQN